MNIDYWLIESQEDLEKFEMTTEIASPSDMAKAIKRVRELHNNNVDIHYCSHCSNCFIDERKGLTFHSTPVKYPCSTIKALDGGNE
jgi:hypothetical protein